MRPAAAIVIGLLLGSLPALFIRAAIKIDRPVGVTFAPVVFAAKPLATGAVLTMDDISQRGVPEALVTAGVVKPSEASYVVNQPLAVPLAKGDPLPWLAHEALGSIEGKRPAPELVDACTAELTKRNVATPPPTVAELRAAILGGRP